MPVINKITNTVRCGCYSTIVCVPVKSFMKFIPFVTYSDKYWHSKVETNPGKTKMMTARQQLLHKTTGLTQLTCADS